MGQKIGAERTVRTLLEFALRTTKPLSDKRDSLFGDTVAWRRTCYTVFSRESK